MIETQRERIFPAGLVVAALLVFCGKAAALSLQASGSLAQAWQFALLDLDGIGLLLLLGALTALARARPLRLLGKATLFLALVFYAIHSFVLVELDESMSLFDLARYLPEWPVVQSFLGPLSVLAVAVLLAAPWIDLRLERGPHRAAATLAVVLLAGGLAYMAQAPSELRKYSLLQAGAVAEQWMHAQPASAYTPAQRRLHASAAAPPAEFMQPEPNIILLVIESLSSINSQRTSGVLDLLPDFDRLSHEGVLFPNFFANHAASEGGLIALLSGFPPLHYPTASPLMFDEFAMQPAVVQEYMAQGYMAEFLTNTDLAFIGMDRYLDGLGLDRASGRDEVEAWAGAERFVQDAPSDRHLYAEALRRVDARSADDAPWIMTLASVSTHLPYTHPEGGEDSAEAVWDWAMARLLEFHDALGELGFYRNGLLLVTGDHRQMRPLSRAETERYGDSAVARVPLLVIGAGVEPGGIDERWFQQADLLRYLPRIWQPERPLSPHPVWVERYNRIYGRVESINRFGVFDQADGGRTLLPVQVLGTELAWAGQRPGEHRAIEARVHAQRSAHQFARNGPGLGCPARMAGSGAVPAGRAGGLGRLVQSMADSGGAQLRGFLEVAERGTYWFRSVPGVSLCFGIAGRLVIDQKAGQALMQAPVALEPGLHPLELRYFPGQSSGPPALEWVTPGLLRWRWRAVPDEVFRPAVGEERAHE